MHSCQERNLCLGGCSSKVPETETINCNRHNTELIEKSFLKTKQTSSKVAKHTHCLYSKQCLDRVVSNILLEKKLSIKVLEKKLSIKVKAQVSLVCLGLGNRSTNS